MAGKWFHLGKLAGSAEMLDRVKSGCYPMRWIDNQGVQRYGRLPEHLLRLGDLNAPFGLLTFEGRDYQRIEVELDDGQSNEAVVAWEDPADIVMISARVRKNWRPAKAKPSAAEIDAKLAEKYSEGSHPGEKAVWATVPTATRQQVRDAIERLRLKGERGHRSQI